MSLELCLTPLFFKCTTNPFSGAHTTPAGKLRHFSWQSSMMYWERVFPCILWGLVLWPIEKPIVINICGFGLPNIYFLFPGNRISVFFTLVPVIKCALIPPPSCGLQVWPGLDQWVCALLWVRDGHETQLGPMNLILRLRYNCWGMEVLGWAGTLWGQPRVVGGHLVLMSEQFAGE